MVQRAEVVGVAEQVDDCGIQDAGQVAQLGQ
jgi:hypothetical protein